MACNVMAPCHDVRGVIHARQQAISLCLSNFAFPMPRSFHSPSRNRYSLDRWQYNSSSFSSPVGMVSCTFTLPKMLLESPAIRHVRQNGKTDASLLTCCALTELASQLPKSPCFGQGHPSTGPQETQALKEET